MNQDGWSATELRLSGLWREVLGRDPQGRADNFFDSGGDSITALSFLAKIRRDFGIELPLSSLFDETQTLDSLAREVDARLPAQPQTL